MVRVALFNLEIVAEPVIAPAKVIVKSRGTKLSVPFSVLLITEIPDSEGLVAPTSITDPVIVEEIILFTSV